MTTRKEEVVLTTSNLHEMKGMYLKGDLYRKWTEDFVDQASGELVSVERKEMVMKRGTILNDDNLQKIMFYQQTGEIDEVEVSSQLRLAEFWQSSSYVPTMVKVRVDGVPKKVLLWASSCENAIACVKDYVELKFRGFFTISEVKIVGGRIVDIDETLPEEVIEKCGWYQVVIFVDFKDLDNEGTFAERIKLQYMVFAIDADQASAIAFKECNGQYDGKDAYNIPDDISVRKVTPYPCDELIDIDFCKAYV